MDTSWQKASRWYGKIVGEEGHYFHQKIVIPKVLELLKLKNGERLLDVACGNGVMARSIQKEVDYTGVDLAKGLIRQAEEMDRNRGHRYMVADVTKEIPGEDKFDKAIIILALQNIKEPEKTIKLVSERLVTGGKLMIVLNHPCFRIPRQSSWEMDEGNKMQYRRINRYLSPLEVPLNVHPSQRRGPITWSYHRPLSNYTKMLTESNMLIENLEEWASDKKSEGSAAKMENRAREEFPMFLAIYAIKREPEAIMQL